MRTLLAVIACAASMRAAHPNGDWLEKVAPVITAAEKKLYLSLEPEARGPFEQQFWASKSIGAEEYFRRLQYIDSKYGSSKIGSGANTDPGRVYLSIGPPARVTRIPSSRIFTPLEIWYYDTVPELHLSTELRLIFYQPRSVGLPRLYSPTLDTIRALLLPQAGSKGMFGPNDDLTEAKIRNILTTGIAEDEVISAAVNVASGIKYSGNDQILGQITSPMAILGRAPRADVKSKFITAGPKLDVLITASSYGGLQVDLGVSLSARQEIEVEVQQGPLTVYQNRLRLQFPKAEPVRYLHRLDLLRGSYRFMITVDGTGYPYPIEVPERAPLGEILRANATISARHTPFEFDHRVLELNPEGTIAAVSVEKPGKVVWILRKGLQQVWKSTTDATQIAVVELPAGVVPGNYQLEARSDGGSRSLSYAVGSKKDAPLEAQISFNANLAPALRYAAIGHQWLLRGRLSEARESFEASLNKDVTAVAQVELARADALEGRLDDARDRVRQVLAVDANNFEALSVFAYIEARFQDYAVAAQLYRRALAIQDSPAVRLALAKLPQ